MMKLDSNWIKLAAVLGITILELVALLKGVNGAVLSVVLAILGGIAGFELKEIINKKK